MNLLDFATPFGIVVLVVAVGYRITMVLIKQWRETEKERTAAIAAGFKGLIDKLDTHITSELQASTALGRDLAEIKGHLGIATGPVRLVRPPTKNER
jgi:hypothetical protein